MASVAASAQLGIETASESKVGFLLNLDAEVRLEVLLPCSFCPHIESQEEEEGGGGKILPENEETGTGGGGQPALAAALLELCRRVQKKPANAEEDEENPSCGAITVVRRVLGRSRISAHASSAGNRRRSRRRL